MDYINDFMEQTMKAMFDVGTQHDEWLAFVAAGTLCRIGSVCIIVGIVLGVMGSHAQAPPITRTNGSEPLKGGGVRSRNMELVDIMPFKHNSEDQFELASGDYTSGFATKRKHLLVTAHETQPSDPLHARYGGVKCLRIVDVTDPRNARQDYLIIYVRGKVSGDPDDQATSAFGNFGIHCDAKNLGLSFNDMHTSTNSTVSHCSFERTPGGAGLVSIAFLNVSDRTSLPRNHTLWVENSSFVDNAVTFPAFMITQGVNVSRAHSVYVKNSTFRNLTSGIVSVNLNRLHVEGSYIERCSLGVNSDALEYFMCRNAIENVKFSVNLYTVGQAEHNANGIGNTSFGIRSSAGGVNYYWNNTFDWYGRAIVAEGAGSHRLADFIVQYYIPGNAIPWTIPFVGGRNDFAPTPGRPTTWPAPIQFVDIDLITNGTGMPNLHVECGFNDFSLFSQYHAASNVPYPPLASSVNLWRGAPVQPRLNPNMTWTGVNLTVEEDPLAECYPQMEENASCGPVVVPGGWWSMGGGWTPSVPLVSNVISSNVGEMANPALSADARRLAAFSATAASSATESHLLHGMVRGALTSMSLNTSLPLHVRSTAAVLRAKTYVDRGDLDSAKLLFDGVVAGFPNGADSLNAAWSSMALTAVMAPANNRDSLMAGYVHRVIADLSDRSGAHMVFAKSMDEQPSQSAVAHDIVIGTVAPNPTSGDNLALTITSSHATVGTWELISVQGSIVARGPLRLAAGQSSYTVPIAGIANGMYALRLVADGHVVSTSVSIQR